MAQDILADGTQDPNAPCNDTVRTPLVSGWGWLPVSLGALVVVGFLVVVIAAVWRDIRRARSLRDPG